MRCVLLFTRNTKALSGGWMSHATSLNSTVDFCNRLGCDRGVLMWLNKNGVHFIEPNMHFLYDVFHVASWILCRILGCVAGPLFSDQLFKLETRGVQIFQWNASNSSAQDFANSLPELFGFLSNNMRESARKVWRLVSWTVPVKVLNDVLRRTAGK